MESQEIRTLWQNKLFTGSFSGIVAFRNAVQFEKNITLRLKDIRDALRGLPLYIQHMQSKVKTQYANEYGNFLNI